MGEPTAFEREGHLFALADVLGVQKEIGFTASNNKPIVSCEKHFITSDCLPESYGEGMSMIYKHSDSAVILDVSDSSCSLATNEFGNGRSVYIAGLPYSNQNARVLLRAIYWAAGADAEYKDFYSENYNTECALYEESNVICVVNNTDKVQDTTIHHNGKSTTLTLEPLECKWICEN